MTQRFFFRNLKLSSVAKCKALLLICPFVFSVALADFSDELPASSPSFKPTPTPTPKPVPALVPPSPVSTPQVSSPSPIKKDSPKENSAAGSSQDKAAPGSLSKDIAKHNSSAPFTYQADGELILMQEKGILTLVKNVILSQDDTTMWADRAELIAPPNTTQWEKAIAKGNVKIKKKKTPSSPEIQAEANEIDYDIERKIIVLKGNPKIWRGQEIQQGEIMELNVTTGRFKTLRPKGVFDPKSGTPTGK